MKGTEQFQQTIKAYLDSKAANDALFAKSYADGKKSIEECCNYIFGEVHKSGRNGFADEEIYGMAVHYYDEADITLSSYPHAGSVVVNHAVELSDEDKAKARQKAFDELVKTEKERMQKKSASPKKDAAPQPMLFNFEEDGQ